MKSLIRRISLLAMVFLVGCNVIGSISPTPSGDGGLAGTPTFSDVEMQTQIALLLTAMPSTTPQAQEPTATEALPSLTPLAEQVEATQTETEQATLAPTEMQASETPQPTLESPTTTPTVLVPVLPSPTGPTFTPSASDPRSRLGSPTAADPMDNARGWIWPVGTDTYTTGDFQNGSLVLTARDTVDGWRIANPRGSDFANLYLEGTFRPETCAGSDHYGLIARVPVLKEADQGYLFGVTCDGRYSLRRWDGKAGKDGKMDWLVRWTASPAIVSGSNQVNRLGLMMVGSRLLLYANGTLLTEVKDSVFAQGYFGVFVGADQTNRFTVNVDDMAYWENPQP